MNRLKIKNLGIIGSIFFFLFFGIFLNSCKYKSPRWTSSFVPYAPALEHLPLTKKGYTDWVRAIDEGIIAPREYLDTNPTDKQEKPLDLDILLEGTKGGLMSVIFPHKAHTVWLKCANCHPEIFKKKRGGNQISMTKIAKGEYCGRCHGKVAFPLDDCMRCHNGPIINPVQ